MNLNHPLRTGSRVVSAVIWTAHTVVLVLSAMLIVYISYDTFKEIPLLESRSYMRFQFWVCVVFLIDFFLELAFAPDKKKYLAGRWFYFLISIPYLNIIRMYDISFGPTALYFIRFIPLVRGAYSLATVVAYFSSNRAVSVLSTYCVILLSIVYFASLIFFQQERHINPGVKEYWDALWWAAMNVTTVGCSINPLTLAGKVSAVVLAMSGMMMLPLFTVYISAKINDYNKRNAHSDALTDGPEKIQSAVEEIHSRNHVERENGRSSDHR